MYQPLDYKIADDTILNPDLLLVCKPIQKAFLDFAPELVVEILSPATALKDRHTKYEIYQDQKIQYYLIVDADMHDVEVYRLSERSVYERASMALNRPFQFHLPECNFEITFENIWS